MNHLMIIGNLTADPVTRMTQGGLSVCSFTVAVNRRRREGQQPEADFFRVSAWRQLGENCQKYLLKGRKVAITGSVSVSTYNGQDGKTRASLDVTASDVEFLTPKEQAAMPEEHAQAVTGGGYVDVTDDEQLPF